MRGHIRQRGKDTWQIIIPAGKDAHGKYKYASETVHGTKKDAEARLAELLVQARGGKIQVSSRMTLGEYLDLWYKRYSSTWRPDTQTLYEMVIRNHIKPALGHIRMDKLTPFQVQEWVNSLATKGLANDSVHGYYRVLRSAINQAIETGILAQSPLKGVKPPKRKKQGGRALSEEEVKSFLSVIQGHPRYPLYLTAIATGMREGELLGLQWQDVDLEHGVIRVRQQLKARGGVKPPRFAPVKTDRGERLIPLPPIVTEVLHEYKAEQDREKEAYGASYADYDLVFTVLGGGAINPRNLVRQFKGLLEKAGLPLDIRFHDMRHSCLTLLAEMGVELKTISEQAGHSDVAFTLRVYGHVLPRSAWEAAHKMERLLADNGNGLVNNLSMKSGNQHSTVSQDMKKISPGTQ